MEGTRNSALKLLQQGELVGLAPGGMRESLRTSDQKYRINWRGRTGFIRVALRARAPIVLCACPTSDDIYKVYKTPLTEWVYNRFKFPMPIFRGIGFSAVPRPAKLWHLIGEPIEPPADIDPRDDGAIDEFHQEVTVRMEQLMKQALNKPVVITDVLKRRQNDR